MFHNRRSRALGVNNLSDLDKMVKFKMVKFNHVSDLISCNYLTIDANYRYANYNSHMDEVSNSRFRYFSTRKEHMSLKTKTIGFKIHLNPTSKRQLNDRINCLNSIRIERNDIAYSIVLNRLNSPLIEHWFG